MQIIIVSRHLKAARTFHIMPRHLLGAAALFVALVLAVAALFSWISLNWRLPIAEDALLAIERRNQEATHNYITGSLEMMATRLGELQGRVLQLDVRGDRLFRLGGESGENAAKPLPAGQGGPFVPAPMSAGELQQEIDRLAELVEQRSDELAFLEFRLLEKRVAERLMPTTLPVAEGVIGSGFGYRTDPFAGVRARHDGLDFSAPVGTPVYAAADGVVAEATFHGEFGNVVDLDHGQGLMSRYAHLSEFSVKPGQLVRRGERLGSVGNTGRSTGSHLHFEVRMQGVAQNPAAFLKRNEEFLRLTRR